MKQLDETLTKRLKQLFLQAKSEYAEDYLDMIDSYDAIDHVIDEYDLETLLNEYNPSEVYDYYLLKYNQEYTVNGIAKFLSTEQQLINELIFQLDSDSCQEIINQIKNYHKDRVTW